MANKKRWLCLLMAGMMTVGGLSACGKSPKDGDETMDNDNKEQLEPIDPPNGTTPLTPATERCNYIDFNLGGFAGQRFEDNVEGWLKVALDADPAMLDCFFQRDKCESLPVLWAGEFPGKFLVSLCYAYEMTRDEKLYAVGDKLIGRFEELAKEEAYLGPYDMKNRLVGWINGGQVWDLWGQYHLILGLVKWWEITGETRALDLAKGAADYILDFFSDRPFSDGLGDWAIEMNISITHAYAKLYNVTGEMKYLEAAESIVQNEWITRGGDWFRNALKGIDFYQSNLPRWESLHPIMALAELYIATGKEDYRTAYSQIWESLLTHDIHNAGSFSTNEKAVGNPWEDSNIETCCTIAWAELTLGYLRITGDPRAADELERTQFNGIYASQLELDITNGYKDTPMQFYTYDTRMNGQKEGAIKTLSWQSWGKAIDVSCCQLNGPKGPSLIGQWGFLKDDDGYTLNWYGESTIDFYGDGFSGTLRQETEYPVSGAVKLTLSLTKPVQTKLRLRIPAWSKGATVSYGGKTEQAAAGTYYTIEGTFSDGDVIELDLGVGLRTLQGGGAYSECLSWFYGPVLLAAEKGLTDPDSVVIPAGTPLEAVSAWGEGLLQVNIGGYQLIDYGSAGRNPNVTIRGPYYRSWIKKA